jgi:AcrR family transcriptional regulator
MPAQKRPAHRIKQDRARETYDRLVAAAFELLEDRELEDITIAELARAAGYSVGAFYARFTSKDEFFEALIADHIVYRTQRRTELFATLRDDELIDRLIEDLVTYFWRRRHFWRAALKRSIRDPDFWEPLRKLGRELADALIARIESRRGRPLTQQQTGNVGFAVQITLGTINNAIFNRPGPMFIGQTEFVANLARAFRLVSDFDRLTGIAAKAAPTTRR